MSTKHLAGFFLSLITLTSCPSSSGGGGSDGDANSNEVTSLQSSSPSDGERGVSLRRETILTFGAAVDSLTVADGIEVTAGSDEVSMNIHTGADPTRVTIFYPDGLPASAQVTIRIDGDVLRDTRGRLIDMDGDGVPGGIRELQFSTFSVTGIPGTDLCGRVMASVPGDSGESFALEGVTISVDGAEDDLFAITNAKGEFRLEDAPGGTFFVHVNGQTADSTPAGFYYPSVGKAWTAVPGQEKNVGTVFLPAVSTAALQSVSLTEATSVALVDEQLDTFDDEGLREQLEQVRLVVAADSLFADDGTRGGAVGLAPVDPDRLPGTLPEGLDIPLVLTVQTDGASNFEVPASLTLPVLGTNSDGSPLEPGDVTGLWSFNHDRGLWEVVGPMRVSSDGLRLETEAGVGVLAPGWHGGAPGSQCDSEPDDPCPGFGGWDVVWDMGRAALGCVKRLREALERLSALLDALDGAVSLGTEIANVILALQDDDNCEAIASGLAGLNAAKSTVKNGLEVVAATNPIGKATDAVACATALCRSVTDELCENPECHGSFANGACLLVDTMKGLIEQVIALINSASEGETIMILVCVKLDQAQMIADQICSGDPAGVDTDDLLAALLEAQVATEEFEEAATSIRDLMSPLSETEETSETIMQDVIASVIHGGDGFADARWHLVTGDASASFEQRGVANASGFVSVPVAANQPFIFRFYVPNVNAIATAEGMTPPPGTPGNFGNFTIRGVDDDDPDSDEDGLSDEAEDIVGTSLTLADTDGDGLGDRAELDAGSDPLDGILVTTGLVGSAPVEDFASGMTAEETQLYVADRSQGVAIFNVFNGMLPLLVGRVDTPSPVLAIHELSGRLLVLTDESLLVYSLEAPSEPVLEETISIVGGSSLAGLTDVAFVGTDSGSVLAIDLATGAEYDRVTIDGRVEDLTSVGDVLYALARGELSVIPVTSGALSVYRTVAAAAGAPVADKRQRLFGGSSYLLATTATSWERFNLSDPLNPWREFSTNGGQFGWRHTVGNGTSVGVAAVGPNSDGTGASDVQLLNVSTTQFLNAYTTPGSAEAIGIVNGLAYVADGSEGVQVVNYLAFDTAGENPVVQLDSSPSGSAVEELSLLFLGATAADDVQVRNVELSIDGVLVETDVSYPFEFTLRVPALDSTTSFDVSVQAIDTGGNRSEPVSQTYAIVPDTTSPILGYRSVQSGGVVDAPVESLLFGFNEAIESTSIDGSVSLLLAGSDGEFDSEDDIELTPELTLLNGDRQLRVITGELDEGLARLRIDGSLISDLSGNPLDADGDGRAGEVVVIDFDILWIATSGKPVTLVAGSVSGVHLSSLTDGVFLPRHNSWTSGTVYWGGSGAMFEIDLLEDFILDRATVQADDNDAYRVEYWDDDAEAWTLLWNVANYDGYGSGMQTRPNPSDDTQMADIPKVTTNRLRFRGISGDGNFSCSEIRIAGRPIR